MRGCEIDRQTEIETEINKPRRGRGEVKESKGTRI